MTKYGRQQRDIERRESKQQEQAFLAPSTWTPDPELETIDSQETDYPGNRLVSQRTVKYVRDGLIVEFAVVVKQQDASGEWAELLCIDTCNHGTVHRHVNGDHSDEGREDISKIETQEDVQNGFWDAIGEAYELAYGEGTE